MVEILRLSYLSKTKLKMIATWYNKSHEPNLCFTPMCRYCKIWLLEQICVYKSFGSLRFICIQCFIRMYGKRVFKRLLYRHLDKLSKTDMTLRSLRTKYVELLNKI